MRGIYTASMVLVLLFTTFAEVSFNPIAGSETGLESIMTNWGAAWPWGVTLIDYNNDDKMDIIATNHGHGGVIIKNVSTSPSTPQFQDVTAQLGIDPHATILGGDGRSEVFDWNGDGYIDIANFSDEQTLKNLENRGGSTFVALESVMRPISHFQDIRDINGDGYLDLLSIKGDKHYDPQTGEFTPKGPWTNPHPRSDKPDNLPTEITDAYASFSEILYFKDQYFYHDFDRDGYEDLLVSCFTNYIDSASVGWLLMGDGAGNYENVTTSVGLPSSGTPISYFDFNYDGYLDIIYTMGDAPGLYLSDSQGRYVLVENEALNTMLGYNDPYCHRIVLSDFDNDRDADLIAIRPRSGDSKIFENVGEGVFMHIESFSAWDNESIVGARGNMLGKGGANVHDFTGDGKVDIILGGPGMGKSDDIDITLLENSANNDNNVAFVYPRMDVPNIYAAGAYFEFFEAGTANDVDAIPFWIQFSHPNGTPMHVGLGSMLRF